jgi:hypothetical protein
MTVSSSTSRVQFNGNGSTTVFAYSFKIFDQDDLTVIVRSATGTETVKTITTHYTVSGVGNAGGGNVTMLTAPASGETLTILREQDLVQELNLVENDPFPSQSLEDALDKLTFIVQQHDEELARTIKASRTNTITSTEFTVSAASRANKIFAFDSAGELAVTQELGTYRGNWATSTAFAQRDIVKDTSNNNIYICVTAHTSTGSQPISSNTDVAKWALLVDAASATSSADAAAASASAAATSETNAETAQAAAEAAQTAAELAETNAETAETNAEAAQIAAEAAQAAAELIYDNFDDRYLGSKTTAPTVDNDGNPLINGALYFNTTSNVMQVYNGAAWQNVAPVATSITVSQISDLTATAAELNILDGITGIASQAQAEAGTDNVTLMTPLRTAEAIDALTPPSGTQTFVATGTIPDGSLVGLNADGTISVVTPLTGPNYPNTIPLSNAAIATAYDPATNRIFVAAGYSVSTAYIVAGTVSGSTITFGTPATFAPAYEITSIGICFNAAQNNVTLVTGMIRYISGTTKYFYGDARLVTFSGTTPTVGAASYFYSSPNTGATFVFPNIDIVSINGSTSVAVISTNNYASVPALGCTITVSSSAITGIGGLYTVTSEYVATASYDSSKGRSLCYDPVNSRVVFQFVSASVAGTSKVVLGTISGTVLSFGSPVSITPTIATATATNLSYNPFAGGFVYAALASSGQLYLATGSISGGVFTLGTPLDVSIVGYAYQGGAISIDSASSFSVPFRNSTTEQRLLTYKISGASISLAKNTLIGAMSPQYPSQSILVGDAEVAVVYTSGSAVAVRICDTASTYASWVGIAAETISSGQEGDVTVIGGVNQAQSGLVAGTQYGIDPSTALLSSTATPQIGFATSPTSIYVNAARI